MEYEVSLGKAYWIALKGKGQEQGVELQGHPFGICKVDKEKNLVFLTADWITEDMLEFARGIKQFTSGGHRFDIDFYEEEKQGQRTGSILDILQFIYTYQRKIYV
jgi:hypothetical protein